MYKTPDEIFPVTIVCDRYTGAYSGGAWTAWQLDTWDIPSWIEECDFVCRDEWRKNTEPVGLGDTPQEALQDLMHKLNEYCYKMHKELGIAEPEEIEYFEGKNNNSKQ